jgi:adenylate kinase family enzyme
MKCLCLFLLLAALTAAGQTNPPPFCCRQPYRVMGAGQPVDLSPLIAWWVHQGAQVAALPLNAARAPRPLRAWKRITGFRTGEVEGAWVLHAEVALSPTERTNEWILLKNPPAVEAAQYYNLQYLLPQYEHQIAEDRRKQEEYTKAATRSTAQARQVAQNYSKSIRWDAPYYTQLADQNKNAAAAALADQHAMQQALDQARQQLKTLPSVNGQYQVDVFALELGRNARGQPIFDAGAVYGTGP